MKYCIKYYCRIKFLNNLKIGGQIRGPNFYFYIPYHPIWILLSVRIRPGLALADVKLYATEGRKDPGRLRR